MKEYGLRAETTQLGKRVLAPVLLLALLLLAFAPAIFGGKTLLLSSWDAPSVTSAGAYDQAARPPLRLQRTSDPGAPAWQTEPWFALIGDQFWREFNWPLWNPYSAYGTPLAAAQQPQPFFPLATALSLDVTPTTYNLFIVGRLFVAALLMFLFARQFLSALPSLFAAVAFSLSGYFIVFVNMPHVSVEVLTPGVLLAFELLLRRNSWSAVALAAAMILLGMSGGMPESLFLTLAFGSVYFVGRLLFAPAFRARAGSLIVKFIASVILGFALSAFLLLPFVEFLRLGHDVHQLSNVGGMKTGLVADSDYRFGIQYLLPLIFGPILNSTLSTSSGFSGLKGYWGLVTFFFAAMALFALVSRRRLPDSGIRFLIAFFAATFALMILKRFGNITVNWIGHLPVANLVLYPKYQEPLLGLCVAMLGGIGFSLLVEKQVQSRRVLLIGAVVLALVLVLAASFVPALRAHHVPYAKAFFSLSVAAGAAAVAGVVLLSWLAGKAARQRVWLLRSLVVALGLELTFNFLVPSFYLLNKLPPATANPYAGAPYINFLKAHNTDHARVFGRENMLYPNWSSVFGIADVRTLDAIQYARYRAFVRNFLLPPGFEARINGDLADRFTGQEFSYAFDTDVEQRFLALSSVRYLLTDSDYGFSAQVADEILRQHQGEYIWGFGPDTFRADASVLRGVLQHPPSTKVPYKTVIAPERPIFEGVAVIKENAIANSDGAGFHLEVRDGGKSETLFETFLNPRDVATDRGGRAFRIDLSRYAGRAIELVFSTDPGPKGDNAADWAGWAGLQFVPPEGAPPATPFTKVYDAELRIYEVPLALPRASLYRAIELVSDAEVLARLREAAFDPQERAIVSRESLPVNALGLAQLAQATPTPASAASITRYESQYVRIEADAAEPVLLVLNDANYPGWQAYLNGAAVPTVAANYLFRGVLLQAGKSVVEFRYQPMSFRAGGAIAVVAFLTLAGLVFHERRQRRARG